MKIKHTKGEKNFKNKLSEEDVRFIFFDTGHTQKELANRYGVTQGTISHIKSGKTWEWLTCTNDIAKNLK